jgi:DNA invertase Pin-like site-specific DNA recombinase
MPRKGSRQVKPFVDYSAVRDVFVPYRRVSTREQADDGVGLVAQKTMIRAGLVLRSARALTWDQVDAGKSGKDLKRPKLTEALEIVRRGEAGGIMVSKLDRLSRSLIDFATLMNQAKAEGWNIVCLDVSLDLMTSMGSFVAGILALFAQFERERIGERTKEALEEKRAEGIQLGRRRTMTDDLLESIIAMYHDLDNYSKVARWLNDVEVPTAHGGAKWYPSTIKYAIESPDGRAIMERLEAA